MNFSGMSWWETQLADVDAAEAASCAGLKPLTLMCASPLHPAFPQELLPMRALGLEGEVQEGGSIGPTRGALLELVRQHVSGIGGGGNEAAPSAEQCAAALAAYACSSQASAGSVTAAAGSKRAGGSASGSAEGAVAEMQALRCAAAERLRGDACQLLAATQRQLYLHSLLHRLALSLAQQHAEVCRLLNETAPTHDWLRRLLEPEAYHALEEPPHPDALGGMQLRDSARRIFVALRRARQTELAAE